MCKKAQLVIPNSNVTRTGDTRTGRSKYYSMKLLEIPVSVETADPLDSSAADDEITFVEAFKCPTDPEIYVHISDEGRNGHTFGVIMKRSERPALTSNIVAYLARTVLHVKRGT